MAFQNLGPDPPEVPILLLGDEGVGKSTFLSRCTLPRHSQQSDKGLPLLRDLDQPFPFEVRFSAVQLRLEFYDTASPQNYLLLRPAVIVLCYAINDPNSLKSVQTKWKYILETHFNYNENLPILLLGLKRDAREREDYGGSVKILTDAAGTDFPDPNVRQFVYPQEGLQIAQEMRLDRYCECSALTGELCREVFEDISKTAAMTLTAKGGRSEGTQCSVM